MPRLSADARAAAAFRTGGHRPPPRGLCPRARAIWRAIVLERPVDWFDAGSAPLLRIYVVLAAYAEQLEVRLVAGDRRALGELVRTSRTMTTLAVKLRLSVQSTVRRDAGMLDERLPVPAGPLSRLLGGRAFRVVKDVDAN